MGWLADSHQEEEWNGREKKILWFVFFFFFDHKLSYSIPLGSP